MLFNWIQNMNTNYIDQFVVLECCLLLTLTKQTFAHKILALKRGLVSEFLCLCEAFLWHTLDQFIRIFYGCGFWEDVEVFLRSSSEHSSFSASVDTFCKIQVKTVALFVIVYLWFYYSCVICFACSRIDQDKYVSLKKIQLNFVSSIFSS